MVAPIITKTIVDIQKNIVNKYKSTTIMPYTYKTTNVINNRPYIGKTSYTNIEQQFREHLNDAKTKR